MLKKEPLGGDTDPKVAAAFLLLVLSLKTETAHMYKYRQNITHAQMQKQIQR